MQDNVCGNRMCSDMGHMYMQNVFCCVEKQNVALNARLAHMQDNVCVCGNRICSDMGHICMQNAFCYM